MPASTSPSNTWRSLLPQRRSLLLLCAIGILIATTILMPRVIGGQAGEGANAAKVSLGLGVLGCIAFLWLTEALPLALTALLVPVIAASTGICDLKSALHPFADPLIFLFFGGFALGSALSHQKLDQWIAHKLIRWGQGRFMNVSLLLFACTAFLSMWMSNTATTALMLPIALGLMQHWGSGEPATRNRLFLLLGIAYSAGIGGLGTIIGSPPNGIAAAKLDLSFVQWMGVGIPCVIVLLPCLALMLLKICRPDRTLTFPSKTTDFVFNRTRFLTLAIFLVTAICWMCGGWLARRLGIAHSIDTVIALLAVFLLVITRVIGWKEIEQGTDWSVLLLFGGGLALSEVLHQTGASRYVAHLVSEQISDAPFLLIVMGAVAFAIISAAFTSNTGSAALLIPIFYAVAMELDLKAELLILPIALASSCSFLLPISTPPNAIVYGTGLVPQQAMIKNGFCLSFLCFLLISLVTFFLN